MAPTVEFGHPTTFRSGDTVAYRFSHTDYPVSESWVYSAALVSLSSSTQIPLTWSAGFVTNDGAEWTITIPATTSDDFIAGSYQLTAYATLAGARYTMYDAGVMIEANRAVQTAGQGLRHAEKQLAIVEAEIEARVTGTGSGHNSYQLGPRAINKYTLEELRRYRAALKIEVERLRGRPSFGREVHMNFVAPAGTSDPLWETL